MAHVSALIQNVPVNLWHVWNKSAFQEKDCCWINRCRARGWSEQFWGQVPNGRTLSLAQDCKKNQGPQILWRLSPKWEWKDEWLHWWSTCGWRDTLLGIFQSLTNTYNRWTGGKDTYWAGGSRGSLHEEKCLACVSRCVWESSHGTWICRRYDVVYGRGWNAVFLQTARSLWTFRKPAKVRENLYQDTTISKLLKISLMIIQRKVNYSWNIVLEAVLGMVITISVSFARNVITLTSAKRVLGHISRLHQLKIQVSYTRRHTKLSPMENRETDDFSPRYNLRQLFNQEKIGTTNNAAVKKFCAGGYFLWIFSMQSFWYFIHTEVFHNLCIERKAN